MFVYVFVYINHRLCCFRWFSIQCSHVRGLVEWVRADWLCCRQQKNCWQSGHAPNLQITKLIKRTWLGSCDHLKILEPNYTFGMDEGRHFIFGVQIDTDW